MISAPWPSSSGPVDTGALQQFEALQSVVRSIRNARAEYGVELGRKIPATICVAADNTRCVLHAAYHMVLTVKKPTFAFFGPRHQVCIAQSLSYAAVCHGPLLLFVGLVAFIADH